MAGNIKGITIEIGGDTTKLEKALKNVNTNARDLNKQLREVEKSLKFNPGNTELISQKQRILAESVENTKKKLDTLKEAQEQAKKALADGKIGQDEYDALTREIIKTENQLKSLQGELDKTNSKWKDVGDKLQKTGDKMAKVGEGMTKGVTAPIAAVAGLSIAAFKEVDNGLDTVISKTGATGEAAKSLEESFRNVASNMPASFDEVGNAIGEVNTQFGLTGEALEKASQQIIKFAQINGADVTASTISAKQAIEKYGLSAKDLDMVLDSVTKTAQNTGVSTDRLFDIVVKGSPQLKELGLNFSQATEMMGRMEQKGIDSSKALSYMTRAQTTWAKQGKSITQGLKEMQEKLASATTHEEKLAIAAEAFGTKGGAFMLEVLESGALNADEFANAMEDAAGSVDETWEGMLDPIDLVKQALNNLKMSGADLGTALQRVLLPVIQNAIGAFKKFSDFFSKLSPKTQDFIVKVGLIAAAIGPVLVAIGKLGSGLGKTINFFSAGGKGAGLFAKAMGLINVKALIVIGLIGALIAAGVFLYKNWDTIKEKATEIWGAITEYFKGLWNGVSQAWTNSWNAIKTTLTTIWKSFTSAATTVFNAIKTAIDTVWNALKGTTSSTWNGIKSTVGGVWNDLKTTATTIFNAIKAAIDTVWNAVKTSTSTIWNGIKTVIQGIWNGIKATATTAFNAIKAAIDTVWNAIKTSTSSIWNGIKSTVEGIWNGLKSTAASTWNAIKAAIETPINAAKETVRNAVNAIKGFFSNLRLEIPPIKMPKFPSPKIRGHFGLNPPSAPKISWHDKGGIFDKPSIIGVGEKRPEFVGALDDLKSIFAEVIDKKGSANGGVLITGNTFVVREEADIKKIAKELNKLQQNTNRGRGVVAV